MMLEGHKKRAEKVRGYFAKNKAVTLITVLVAIAVLVNLVSKYQTKEQANSKPESVQETEEEHWRFYPVDLIVLGAGGGLCTVMMLQEKRRAKEELQ